MDISPDVLVLIESLRAEIASLKQEVSDLRRQLNKDSSNSSQPPSSDGFKKKPRVLGSLRESSGKPSGGQTGHKGGTLRLVSDPDEVMVHEAWRCKHCDGALSATMATGTEKRQVFDVPIARLEVTEHQARIYRCTGCGQATKAPFPDGVCGPVQYGPRLRATAIYLQACQLMPEDRISEAMADLFGAKSLCPASIMTWCRTKARDLAGLQAEIAQAVARAPVRHLDETGFRIAGRLQWLHTASTSQLTSYRVSQTRGDMPKGLVGGLIVHDHFKSYYTIAGVEHALCNAHHLRELKDLSDNGKELWAQNMAHLLRAGLKAVQHLTSQERMKLDQAWSVHFNHAYDQLVAEALDLHQRLPPLKQRFDAPPSRARRPGHNLALRLATYKAEVLRFLSDVTVPFTNNQAEQDIRMMKVKMKISGTFRSFNGAKTFATLRSVLSTARKQGRNMLVTLTATPKELQKTLLP